MFRSILKGNSLNCKFYRFTRKKKTNQSQHFILYNYTVATDLEAVRDAFTLYLHAIVYMSVLGVMYYAVQKDPTKLIQRNFFRCQSLFRLSLIMCKKVILLLCSGHSLEWIQGDLLAGGSVWWIWNTFCLVCGGISLNWTQTAHLHPRHGKKYLTGENVPQELHTCTLSPNFIAPSLWSSCEILWKTWV